MTLLVASGCPFSTLLLVYRALFGRGGGLISALHGLLLVRRFGVWRILLVLALVSGLRLGVACGRLLNLLGRLLLPGVRTPVIRRGVVIHLRLLGLGPRRWRCCGGRIEARNRSGIGITPGYSRISTLLLHAV